MTPTFSPRTLDDLMEEADFAVAEQPTAVLEKGKRIVRGIFRRVEAGTPL